MRRILVTGASGFVGGAVVRRLVRDGSATPRAAVRGLASAIPVGIERILVGDLGPETDWAPALRGIDVVVHTAARVHVMRERALDPLTEFRRANVAGTMALASQASTIGVKRFVFISSVKVNGEGTQPGRPYRADDPPAPVDPYGISKDEAEQGLRQLSQATGMEVTIIRPVLVYGPRVKGNVLAMMRWLRRGIPLPLGAIHNQRSLVALDNLVDLIVTGIEHPGAPGRTFLVSDGEDLSTTTLLRRVAAAMGRPARLVPVPAVALLAAARALGKADVAQRLCGSLQVDISATRELLWWAPPVSVDDALRQTVGHFLKS